MNMSKRIKINYREQSKQVVTDTTLEYYDEQGERLINDEVLEESKDLFLKAQAQMQGVNLGKALDEKVRLR